MKKYIESHLRIAEKYALDLINAIEECKDSDPQDYLFALWHGYCQSMRVIEALRAHWPDEFVMSVHSRYVFIRNRRDDLYNALLKALDALHQLDYNPNDDLPF